MIKKTFEIIFSATIAGWADAEIPLTTYVNPFMGTAPLTDPADIGYRPRKTGRSGPD
jgi:hypothetical protein